MQLEVDQPGKNSEPGDKVRKIIKNNKRTLPSLAAYTVHGLSFCLRKPLYLIIYLFIYLFLGR